MFTLELITSQSGELEGLHIHLLTSQLDMNTQMKASEFLVFGDSSIIQLSYAILLFLLKEGDLERLRAMLPLSLSTLQVKHTLLSV